MNFINLITYFIKYLVLTLPNYLLHKFMSKQTNNFIHVVIAKNTYNRYYLSNIVQGYKI